MFDGLKEFLRTIGLDDRARRASVRDPRVAAAALLCHVAEADGTVTEDELRQLALALEEEFGLLPDEAASIMRAGREADADAVDLFHFTSVLMGALSEEERVRFIGLLWSVVVADGSIHELEDNTIWRIAELLGVSTRERMLAKQAALAERNAAAQTADEGR